VDEPGGGEEGDGDAALTSGQAQRQSGVRLARAGISERDDIVALGMAVKSNVSSDLTAGKRAARMRRSTVRRSRSISSISIRRIR